MILENFGAGKTCEGHREYLFVIVCGIVCFQMAQLAYKSTKHLRKSNACIAPT